MGWFVKQNHLIHEMQDTAGHSCKEGNISDHPRFSSCCSPSRGSCCSPSRGGTSGHHNPIRQMQFCNSREICPFSSHLHSAERKAETTFGNQRRTILGTETMIEVLEAETPKVKQFMELNHDRSFEANTSRESFASQSDESAVFVN